MSFLQMSYMATGLRAATAHIWPSCTQYHAGIRSSHCICHLFSLMSSSQDAPGETHTSAWASVSHLPATARMQPNCFLEKVLPDAVGVYIC